MKVKVLFNGIPRDVEVPKTAHVGQLMARAKAEFHPPSSLGELAFFAKDGVELLTHHTLAAYGVADGDTLLLRPTVIR